MAALLLDLYDTLVWTDWPAVSARLTRALKVEPAQLFRAYEVTRLARGRGEYRSPLGDLRAIAAICERPLTDDRLQELAADLIAFMQQNVHLYDEVVPTLRQLRAAGVPVALVSNCDHATRPVVETLGLEGELDTVLLSCEVGSIKPDPAIFQEALRRLNAAPADALFVDDQPTFLAGAAALGIRPIQILRRPPNLPAPSSGDPAPPAPALPARAPSAPAQPAPAPPDPAPRYPAITSLRELSALFAGR